MAWFFRGAAIAVVGVLSCSGSMGSRGSGTGGGGAAAGGAVGTGGGGAATGGAIGTGGAATGGATGTGGAATGGATGTGGAAAGGNNGAGGGGVGGYFLHVRAATVSQDLDYGQISASSGAPERKELRITGHSPGDGGMAGYLTITLAPFPQPGTYGCTIDSIFITTYQLCCLSLYDSRLIPGTPDCTIRLTEVGDRPGTDVAGTFDAVTYDANGGRMFLREGRFRAPITD